MTWRDSYRAASFRGAAFYVESADSDHGRRQAVHLTAQRDTPYTEDLGRREREFSITGYLLGKEYHTSRDELIKAAETAGPGLLVHPYRGEMTVVCRGLKVSESSSEGGKCNITMTFLESGEASYPSVKVDTVNAISATSRKLTDVAGESFTSTFLTTGFPAFVADAASTGLADLGEFMSNPGISFSGDIDAVSSFYSKAQGIVSDAAGLVQKPLQMLDSVLGVVGSIRSAFGANAFSMLTSLFDRYSSVYSGSTSTASRKQQAANYTAMSALIRQASIAEAATAAVVVERSEGGLISVEDTEYDSYQDAIATRDSLAGRLDTESESTVDDRVYVALTDLRVSVVKAIPSPEQDLPRIVDYSPRQTQPSLLVAYQLYGDATRSNEIARRNRPRHPGFLTGGKTLEVLADG